MVLKDAIYNITNGCTGVSYLVLKIKPLLSAYRSLIDIGYKYNYWKVISSVAPEGEGRKKYMVFPIYLTTLTSSLMFLFDLLFLFI